MPNSKSGTVILSGRRGGSRAENPLRAAVVATLAAAILGLCGCAPPGVGPGVAHFSASLDTVLSARRAGRDAVTADIGADRTAEWISRRQPLTTLPGCDAMDRRGDPPALPPCAILAPDPVSPPATGPLAPQTGLQGALQRDDALFDALAAYAHALAAVTDARDGGTLSAAVTGLSTGLSGLASSVGRLDGGAGAAIQPLAPAAGLLGQGLSLTLEARRLAVLAEAVSAADPAVAVLGRTVEADLQAIRAHQVARAQKALHAAMAPLRAPAPALPPEDYRDRLARAEGAVAVLEQTRAADPKALAAALVGAHHRLALSLAGDGAADDPEAVGVALIGSLAAFARAADDLKAAMTPAGLSDAGAAGKK
ncbi:MAG: NAD-glutamate dehydrogenase [Telmatospirillum sp.]|nr:NAD-glutamate dehydrogenase [Telmatospirillum sp.]